MQEIIVSYETDEEIQNLILEHSKKDFLLVQHTPSKKLLHFKYYPLPPESIIIGER